MSEAIYDAEIAPALLALSKKCRDAGMPFLAVVEYEPDQMGRTQSVDDKASLAMKFLLIAAKAGINIDGLFIGIKRLCNELGVNTDASIIMHRMP